MNKKVNEPPFELVECRCEFKYRNNIEMNKNNFKLTKSKRTSVWTCWMSMWSRRIEKICLPSSMLMLQRGVKKPWNSIFKEIVEKKVLEIETQNVLFQSQFHASCWTEIIWYTDLITKFSDFWLYELCLKWNVPSPINSWKNYLFFNLSLWFVI